MFRRNYCPAPRDTESPESEEVLEPDTVLEADEPLEPGAPLEADTAPEDEAALEDEVALEEEVAPEDEVTPEADAAPDVTASPETEAAPSQAGSEIRGKFVSPLRPSETSSASPDRSPLETRQSAPSHAASEPPVFPEAARPHAASPTTEPPASMASAEPAPPPEPVQPQEPADRHSGRVVIGEGVKIVGQIRECRQIEIFGTVDGDLEVEDLVVRENGLLKGNVKAERAEIWGALDGEVSVKEHLDVKSGGSVSGKTEYGALSIATGGRVVGTLDDGSNKLTRPASVSSFTPGTASDRLTGEA